MTREEFDLLERTISAYEVDRDGFAFVGSDVDTAKRLAKRDFIEVRGDRALPSDPGLIAANDFLADHDGSSLLHDPLTPEEFALLDNVIDSAVFSGPFEVADADLPVAEVLASRRLIRLDDGRAEPERRGYRAHEAHDEGRASAVDQIGSSSAAGDILERLLASFANTRKFPMPALFGLLMRQRQNLGRNLQRWAEDKSPLDHCGPEAWEFAGSFLPSELRELQSVRCGGKGKAPTLVAAGLAKLADGALRLTSRPHRWHITQAGHLRIDGVDVASGPTRGLRVFGTFLHDMGYPKVTAKHLHLFRLHRPGEAHAPVGRGPLLPSAELSAVTTALIEGLSTDGGTAKRAGVYLGLSEEQWRQHEAPGWLREDPRPGPWSTHVLRMLPAHPRVITWVLDFEEPLGRGVVTDLLEHLDRHGLASRQGADWHRTPAGSHAIQSEELIDPFAEWVDRHLDDLDGLDGAEFLRSLRRQLRNRAWDARKGWHLSDTVRSRHLSSVLHQATERSLGHGCELAHALWSRTVLDLVGDPFTKPTPQGRE